MERFEVVLGKVCDEVSFGGVNGKVCDAVGSIQALLRSRELPRERPRCQLIRQLCRELQRFLSHAAMNGTRQEHNI